ncbi:MAG: mersacidin/lichenicidin family type 2 lantibiotic [Leptolyngbyaceae cyanobacterium SU_3_3]|nr:mersacidin/lichenicidin family type 2 lantibiotic [Leptolyngbyaceae cyanobacterium SU_3_3]
MSHENIIRAWKDASFRDGLSETERSLLPEHPAGTIELTDTQLESAAGGKYLTFGGQGMCHSGIIACTLPINCFEEQ